MTIKDRTANIVLVGSFGGHPYMNPDWVANFLIKAGDSPKKIDIKIDGLTIEPSFAASANGLTVDVSKSRLTIHYAPFDVEKFDEMERVVKTLSELLPHTTCTAMGVNFDFHGCAGFRTPVLAPIPGLCAPCDANPQVLSCAYRITDTDTLNVTIRGTSVAGESDIAFNFDSRIVSNTLPSLVVAKNKLIDRPLSDCFKTVMSAIGLGEN